MKGEKEIKKKKTPWPTKKAMVQIYEKQLWGGKSFAFYSGDGSHLPEILNPYLDVVTSFLQSFEFPIAVCDLGCGDFNVGKELVPYTRKYVGIDIVPDLITYNEERFKNENLEFYCLNIATDKLPKADCVILRQVLQHLSNAEVQDIVEKLPAYKYVILTEHLPVGDFQPNMDIISGQGIRLKKKSGLDLKATPFNLKVKQEKKLLDIFLNNNTEVIVTSLYEMF